MSQKYQTKNSTTGHIAEKKKTEMNKKKQIIISALATILLSPILSGAIEVRQELYNFRTAMIRDVTTDTFVICEHSQLKISAAISCRLSLVYFELNSAILSPTAAETLLSDLTRSRGMQENPLQVTGHTCQLGSEKLNQTLSLQRAKTVADFLQNHDFTVTAVQGKGSQHPITHDPQSFKKNRRVEITTLP